MINRICKDDKDALDAIDRAAQRPEGRPAKQGGLDFGTTFHDEPGPEKTFNNVQGLTPAPVGNTEQAAIRRLRKDRPNSPNTSDRKSPNVRRNR